MINPRSRVPGFISIPILQFPKNAVYKMGHFSLSWLMFSVRVNGSSHFLLQGRDSAHLQGPKCKTHLPPRDDSRQGRRHRDEWGTWKERISNNVKACLCCLFSFFLYRNILVEYSWFTVSCQFRRYSRVNQFAYACIHSFLDSFPCRPLQRTERSFLCF